MMLNELDQANPNQKPRTLASLGRWILAQTAKANGLEVKANARQKPGVFDGINHWLTAQPSKINRLEASNVERFYETSQELIDTIVEAIDCGQHVALAGPRGCGKSYCIGQAVKQAMGEQIILRGGSVKVQGNKELPRDYLLEDDIVLRVSSKQIVLPARKDAPLFKFAKRISSGQDEGRPVKDPEGRVEVFARLPNGDLDLGAPIGEDQTLVLFLDEVNRFSDGVLDSLLLLLEEGEVIMGGDTFRLPIVVLMTMNPPGYDSSARNLSPPLSARIGRQYRLLSPRLDVLTDTISPGVIARLEARKKMKGVIVRPRPLLIRRAAAVTLCCWGRPKADKAGFEYLSDDTREMLTKIAKTDLALSAAMETLNELCHFGPDARALLDWLKAAFVAASRERDSLQLQSIEVRGRHFVETAITVLSHKVQDSFSSASRPDNTRRKEEAIHAIARALIEGSPAIDDILARSLDNPQVLDAAEQILFEKEKKGELRAAFIECGISSDTDIHRWLEFILSASSFVGKLPTKPKVLEKLEKLSIVEPTDNAQMAFSSESYAKFAKWLGQRKPVPNSTLAVPSWNKFSSVSEGSAFVTVLQDIGDSTTFYPRTIDKYMDRLRCVQDRVWPNGASLVDHIATAGLRATERNKLRTIADCLDTFWIRAEHYGVEVVPPIIEQLCPIFLGLHHKTRPNFIKMIYRAGEIMSKDKSRGRKSRAANSELWRKMQEMDSKSNEAKK